MSIIIILFHVSLNVDIFLFLEKEFKEIDNSADRLIARTGHLPIAAQSVSRLLPYGKHHSAKRVSYFSITK